MKVHLVALLLMVCCVGSPLGAQDKKQSGKNETPITPVETELLYEWISDAAVKSMYIDNSLAAKNGNYLAQDHDELQTYYDLQMDYKYIADTDFRTQLQLPKGQGIMIGKVKPDSFGYDLGFRQGDIVLRVADRPVDDQYKFVIAMKEKRGDKTQVFLRRRGADDVLEFVMPNIEKKEKEKSWILGVNVDPVSPALKKHIRSGGLLILGVVDKSPAQKMGLREHDVIVGVNGQTINNLENLRAELKKSNGAKVNVELIREGNKMSVEIVPMEKVVESGDVVDMTYRFWDLSKANQGGFEFTPVDFDRDGTLDLYLMPREAKANAAKNVNTELQKLSDKIDSIKKQLDELKAKSK